MKYKIGDKVVMNHGNGNTTVGTIFTICPPTWSHIDHYKVEWKIDEDHKIYIVYVIQELDEHEQITPLIQTPKTYFDEELFHV